MRFLHRIYAFIAGYFWLPRDNCGRMFGGHETVPFNRYVLRDGHAMMVCPKCHNAGLGLDPLQQVVTVSPERAEFHKQLSEVFQGKRSLGEPTHDREYERLFGPSRY